MSQAEEIHRFQIEAAWAGDAGGKGEVAVSDGAFAVPIAGATFLGGAGGAANPEELLLAAIGACFVNTWALFLKKLDVAYGAPSVRVAGELEKDPAGGYRMRSAVIHARVPKVLLASHRAAVEKTLGLAEKYCIISKAARAAMTLRVEIEGI
ncbi:MAG: OsmC family protein [Acidobacteriota bacterium]